MLKTLSLTAAITAFAVAPALACGFGKMAKDYTPAQTVKAPEVQMHASSAPKMTVKAEVKPVKVIPTPML
ncbi:MAG: hypothetical protein AAGA88_08850 [Pseudomonadota bacterium]